MYQYRSVPETASDPHIGTFETYGLEILDDGDIVGVQHDVAVDGALVDTIARKCTEEQVEPVHIMDVILNMLV